MKPTATFAAVAGLLLPAAFAAPSLSPTPEAPSHVAGRTATGSGPLGLVTVDDTHRFFPAQAMKISSASSGPKSNGTEFVGQCLTPTAAKYDDCAAALGNLHSYPGNVTLQANLCYNWWERSCLVKVCSVSGSSFTADAAHIADTMTATLLDPCVKTQGKSGVGADCAAVESGCGTYRWWLTEYGGEYDWAV
ncbi:hypothetical protein PG993_000921 [Apiospora rasikravindrae]|uniref:Uncharacterized protein n=1 Tax=Apiospora rasikravindrae TaxID=990691 RepID=A0ABR1U9Y2_9PEZI